MRRVGSVTAALNGKSLLANRSLVGQLDVSPRSKVQGLPETEFRVQGRRSAEVGSKVEDVGAKIAGGVRAGRGRM